MILDPGQHRAFMKFCGVLFERSNLIGTDFQDIVVNKIESEFEQDRAGLRIEFSVSHHAIGKRLNEEMSEAYNVMLPTRQDDQ